MLKKIKKKVDEEYVNSEISKIKDGDLDMVMDNSHEISEKITNASPLKKYTELGKIMIGMVQDFKNGHYRTVPKFTIAAIVFALLYIFNPLDIIPDFIPGVGYIDDLAVFTFGLKFIQTDLHHYLDWKIEDQKSGKA